MPLGRSCTAAESVAQALSVRSIARPRSESVSPRELGSGVVPAAVESNARPWPRCPSWFRPMVPGPTVRQLVLWVVTSLRPSRAPNDYISDISGPRRVVRYQYYKLYMAISKGPPSCSSKGPFPRRSGLRERADRRGTPRTSARRRRFGHPIGQWGTGVSVQPRPARIGPLRRAWPLPRERPA